MKRVNGIIAHPIFQRELRKINRMEKNRIYCRHDMEHFLDVARIAYIMCLEENRPIPADVIYAAALLHDIGRGAQYEIGMPHGTASLDLAEEILRECGYTKEEINRIGEAIEYHNRPEIPLGNLSRILYLADKRSRRCFDCPAKASCHWPQEEKNQGIWR